MPVLRVRKHVEETGSRHEKVLVLRSRFRLTLVNSEVCEEDRKWRWCSAVTENFSGLFVTSAKPARDVDETKRKGKAADANNSQNLEVVFEVIFARAIHRVTEKFFLRASQN